MPSPFPGMDPYMEGPVWRDFHAGMLLGIREALVPHVRPRYVVRAEERVYMEHLPEEERPNVIYPDVTMMESARGGDPAKGGVATASAIEAATVTLTVPMPERRHEVFLTVRARETLQVITVIEVLSPANKRPGSDGRQEYLNKRESILLSRAHLVELDLLRGGERLPTIEPLPPADYYAIISRERLRPQIEVFYWTLRQRLPTIPIPLAGNDPDVRLDLQAVFDMVYDRAGYDYSLDYHRPIEPPLSAADMEWAQNLLQEAFAREQRHDA